MDGVSLAASLLGIGTAGCQIAIKLYTLATQISTSSEQISSISSDISLTSSVLQQLGELVKQKVAGDDAGIFSQSGLETTRASAAVCENIFRRVEQAAMEASEQIRRKGRCTGKIKLSKMEKAKWPFLQPTIADLRTDLREAKGTLMLMLQVTSLAFSKKMAAVHQTASTNIVEQRDVIHAILELSKQATIRGLPPSNQLPVESSSRGQKTISPSAKILPIQPNCMIVMPDQETHDQNSTPETQSRLGSGQPRKNKNISRQIQDNERNTISDTSHTLPTGHPYTPSGSSIDEHQERLELFVMKAIIQDVGDVIQISWATHRIRMQQVEIQKQLNRSEQQDTSPLFDLYENLFAHEHRVIESHMSRAGSSTSLKSLRRTHADMWHRGILFKGVPGLQFVLERFAQRVYTPVAAEPPPSQPVQAMDTAVLFETEAVLGKPRGRRNSMSSMMLDRINVVRQRRTPLSQWEPATRVVHRPDVPSMLLQAIQYSISLRKARFLTTLRNIQYPTGIVSPNPDLTLGYSNRAFRYDIAFLIQFQPIIKYSESQRAINQFIVIPNKEALELRKSSSILDSSGLASITTLLEDIEPSKTPTELRRSAPFSADSGRPSSPSEPTGMNEVADTNLPSIGYEYKRFSSESALLSGYGSPKRCFREDQTASRPNLELNSIHTLRRPTEVDDEMEEKRVDGGYVADGMSDKEDQPEEEEGDDNGLNDEEAEKVVEGLLGKYTTLFQSTRT